MANYSVVTNLKIVKNIPWVFNVNTLNLFPKVPGVYIYGVKVKINKSEKFMPLYVGIINNLFSRLAYHYKSNGILGNGKKELFDLCAINNVADATRIYCDMGKYDNLSGLNPNRLTIPSLIWFNNSIFFDTKLSLSPGTSKYKANSGHNYSIKTGGDLDSIGTSNNINLKNQIINLKQNYTDKFYCAYITLDSIVLEILKDNTHPEYQNACNYNINKKYTESRKNASGKHLCELLENTLKRRLITIGINTSAKSTGKMLPDSDKFDFSNIQNELINMRGAPFQNPLLI